MAELSITVPTTVDTAVETLGGILGNHLDEALLKDTPYNVAIDLHHTLGRAMRNEWGLWHESPLAQEIKKLGIEHPDDMSHHLIEKFCEKRAAEIKKTALDHVLEDE